MIYMEISPMNRRDVGEPDPSASGVAGIGQMFERKTGIVEHGMMGDAGKFFRHIGYTGTIPVEQVPEDHIRVRQTHGHPFTIPVRLMALPEELAPAGSVPASFPTAGFPGDDPYNNAPCVAGEA